MEISLTFNQGTIIESINRKVLNTSKKTNSITSKILDAIKEKDLKKLKKITQLGLPDDLMILRALVWKIILHYLSINEDEWNSTLVKMRAEYKIHKERYNKLLRDELLNKDYQNRELLETIVKDVNRTHFEFNFFFLPIDKENVFTLEELKEILMKRKDCTFNELSDVYKIDIKETHADVMVRMLFIYSQFFFPEISYKQGMNELLAPIYYCFSYDKLYIEESEDSIEADTFWTFFNLMKKIKVCFTQNDQINAISKAKILEELLKVIDPELSNHLDDNGIKFEFFSTKWFILLFSQEFDLSEILRLWDLFFSNDNMFYNIYYTGLAIIESKRKKFLEMDIVGIMQEIQDFKNLNVDYVIRLIKQIKKKYENKIIPIIAKQLEDSTLFE